MCMQFWVNMVEIASNNATIRNFLDLRLFFSWTNISGIFDLYSSLALFIFNIYLSYISHYIVAIYIWTVDNTGIEDMKICRWSHS